MTSGLISKILPVDPKTVRNVAHVFLEEGLEANLEADERSGISLNTSGSLYMKYFLPFYGERPSTPCKHQKTDIFRSGVPIAKQNLHFYSFPTPPRLCLHVYEFFMNPCHPHRVCLSRTCLYKSAYEVPMKCLFQHKDNIISPSILFRTEFLKFLFLGMLLTFSVNAKAQTECSCDHIIKPSDMTSGYLNFNAAKITPGQKICLMGGIYEGRFRMENIVGNADKRILMTNCGGQVIIRGGGQYPAFDIRHSEFFRVSGSGDSEIHYGIKIEKSGSSSGLTIGEFSTDFEADHFEVGNTGFAGIMSKTEPTCNRPNVSWFVQKNTIIHDNYVHHTGGEGFYIGSTGYPMRTLSCTAGSEPGYSGPLEGTKIYNNRVENTGWDGIQISANIKDGAVYNNIITNYATRNYGVQIQGLQLSNDVICDVFNNKILPLSADLRSGPGNGIYSQAASSRIFNNLIVNAGIGNKSGIQINRNQNPIPEAKHHILNNTIINPARAGIAMYHANTGNRFNNNIIIAPTGLFIINTNPPATDTSNNLTALTIPDGLFDDGDYRLAPNSPAIDSGLNVTSLGVTFDLDYHSRPDSGPFDIGAYEYNGVLSKAISP